MYVSMNPLFARSLFHSVVAHGAFSKVSLKIFGCPSQSAKLHRIYVHTYKKNRNIMINIKNSERIEFQK